MAIGFNKIYLRVRRDFFFLRRFSFFPHRCSSSFMLTSIAEGVLTNSFCRLTRVPGKVGLRGALLLPYGRPPSALILLQGLNNGL